ncbi:hypothetical protein GY21_13530 [Cryobacterium roopkundense]|uniref:TP901 family phage tail tape measure protein n=1 Tax=Cryobacterium roopkundense TaxID=1001240 RepID=A0A099J5J1_9MICO|nr:hypothetical protein GY21_13530 [Cryobacterium roopkundense]MBB5641791.1 TP901 family phage tail tape measure protein [Cryobacterium roopkundense]
MSDRTVRVSLTANVAGYLAAMEKARKSTDNVGKSSAEVKTKFEAQNAAMAQLGAGMATAGVVAAASVALAVAKFAEFDQAMSNVSAATHETTENMDLLRDAALDAGGRTVFSATEAANAIEELGKAGLSTQDILGGALNGALDLAAAGGLGVADAAGIAAVALKTFKLEGTDMSHVADLLAAGAGKAMGDVTDLSAALSQSGQVASSTGLSIEETTATLSAFAAQGLLGSDAGTSFKSMLQRLTPQSAEAAAAMKTLGIDAYDAGGNFIGMAKFAGVLQTALKDKTVEERNAAMATIFGSDAVRAATVLYSEGEKGISKWTEAVDDQGYAAETARARLDNLRGDVEALGGAFDTALIQSGSAANDSLRALVQTGTTAVDMFNSAPPIVQEASLALGVATAAIGLTGGAFMLGVPKIVAFRDGMAALNLTMGRTALAGGAVGLGITALAMIIGGVATAQADAKAKAIAYGDTLDAVSNKISASTREMVKANLAADISIMGIGTGSSAYDAAEKIGLGLDLITNAASGNIDAMNELLPLLNKDTSSGAFKNLMKETGLNAIELTRAINDVTNGVKGESASIEDAIRVAQQKQSVDQATVTAADGVASATLTAADAYLAASDTASGLQSTLMDLINSMNELNGVGQDASSANMAYQESLDAVDAQIAEVTAGTDGYVRTLDIGTEAGRSNRAMLDDLAASSQDAAQKQFDLDSNTANYRTTLEAGHQAVVDRAIALGANADEANRIADEISKIPTESAWKMIADTSDANRTIDDFIAAMGRRVGTINFRAQLPDLNGAVSGSGRMGTFATGGFTGIGGKYEPAGIVHKQEFVSTAEATAIPSNRAMLEFMNNGGRAQGYSGGGYVTGQNVQYVNNNNGGNSTVHVNPQVSLAGATITAVMDGRPITLMIQDQIVSANQSRDAKFRRG